MTDSASSIRLTSAVTFEQFMEAVLAIQQIKQKSSNQRTWKQYVGIAFVCLATGFLPHFPTLWIPATCVFATLIIVGAFSLIMSRRLKARLYTTAFDEQKHEGNHELLIDSDGIAWVNQDRSQSGRCSWKAFKACIDTPGARLFLLPNNGFLRVPLECLTEAELRTFRDWSAGISLRP